jgi:hypothetical protein
MCISPTQGPPVHGRPWVHEVFRDATRGSHLLGSKQQTEGSVQMADIHKLSAQVIELAERLENVADAAQGKGTTRGTPRARWLILPAAGAGLYALATSGVLTRQAKDVVKATKARASDLPEELMGRLHDATKSTANGRRRSGSSSSRRSSQRRRKATAS